jgi:hypothetical protein
LVTSSKKIIPQFVGYLISVNDKKFKKYSYCIPLHRTRNCGFITEILPLKKDFGFALGYNATKIGRAVYK